MNQKTKGFLTQKRCVSGQSPDTQSTTWKKFQVVGPYTACYKKQKIIFSLFSHDDVMLLLLLGLLQKSCVCTCTKKYFSIATGVNFHA